MIVELLPERLRPAAKAIVALETEIAKVSWTRAERRDDDKTYNAFAVKDLAAYAPGFDWTAFLAGAELAIVTPIPGTTRDKVSETIQIHGVPVHVIDTAVVTTGGHDDLRDRH